MIFNKTILLLLILISITCADELKPVLNDPRLQELVDTSLVPIPGDDSLLIEQEKQIDSLQNAPLFTDENDTTTDSISIEPINSGFLLGARWGFASSEILNDWVQDQKDYKAAIDQILSDLSYKYSKRWLREPEKQSIAFPVTLGYFHRIDSIKSVTTGLTYAYRSQRSVFNAIEDSTLQILFEQDSRLSHHQLELFGQFQYRFNTEFFLIEKVKAAGIELGAGFIPLSMFHINTESTDYHLNRKATSYGTAVSWSLGIFAEKQSSNALMSRYFFNYHGSFHWGYNNHDELFSLKPRAYWEYTKISFSENFFELGFMFIIKKRLKNEEES